MIQLQENEEVILTVRKHWFVFLANIISIIFVCILLPVVFVGVFYALKSSSIISGNISALLIAIGSLLLLLMWTVVFVMWTDFYLDIVIVTDKQVIDIEQKSLFYREISTTELDKIQDVTSEVDGIVQTTLGFGTIHIENAGEDEDFIIRGVPNPSDIRQKISRQQSIAAERVRTVNISEGSLQKFRMNDTPSAVDNSNS